MTNIPKSEYLNTILFGNLCCFFHNLLLFWVQNYK